MDNNLRRWLEPLLARALRAMPVVVVTGARQTGKTTLANLLTPGRRYLTLDDIAVLEQAERDPASLLAGTARDARRSATRPGAPAGGETAGGCGPQGGFVAAHGLGQSCAHGHGGRVAGRAGDLSRIAAVLSGGVVRGERRGDRSGRVVCGEIFRRRLAGESVAAGRRGWCEAAFPTR